MPGFRKCSFAMQSKLQCMTSHMALMVGAPITLASKHVIGILQLEKVELQGKLSVQKVYSALVHLALHRQKASWKHGPMWKAPAVTSLPIFWHKKCLLQAWLLPMLLARASSHSTIHGVEGMEAIAG